MNRIRPESGVERRCLVYARVSTDDQAKRGYSLADQVELCVARGRELGYPGERLDVIKDEGISGESVDRPGLSRLREMVAQPGLVGHVVIYDPDRFARNLSLQLIVTEEIVRGGALLEFINFEWKDTPEGKLFYSLRGAIAEYEKAKIKERTRRGREQKARQGLMPVGKDLFGYRFNPETDLLEPVAAEQATLRLIRDLVLHGAPEEGRPLSCVQAARWLARHGVPAPRGARWYPSTIARMLRNESYTGAHWVFKTQSAAGKRIARPRAQQYRIAIPPIWDEATRLALIERLESNRWLRRGRRNDRAFLLTGLLRCGACGDGAMRMRGHAVIDGRRNYRYYICCRKNGPAGFDAATGGRVRCPSRHWPARLLDGVVWEAVKAAVCAGGGGVLGLLHVRRDRPDPRERLATERQALEGALARKEAERERSLRLFAMGHVHSEARLAAMLAPIEEDLARLRARREEVETAFAASAHGSDRTALTAERLQEALDTADFERRRAILLQLVKRVTVAADEVRIAGLLHQPGGNAAGELSCPMEHSSTTGVTVTTSSAWS